MNIISLDSVPERANGFSHKAVITYADLNDTAGLTKTLDLVTDLVTGHFVRDAAFYLRTPFDGGATSALSLDVGYDLAAGSDDPDAFLDAYEIHADATEILAGDANGAVFATLRTGHAFKENAKITALFTATGGNLSLLTTGEVWIYLNVTPLHLLG